MAAGPGGGGDDGASPAPAAATDEQASGEARHGFRDYARVLSANPHFCYLWVAETVDNVGSWLSYVATLELASQFSGSSGLALSGVLLIRFLPSLLLAPLCGVVADRVNRVRVLVVAALLDAAAVALLALVRRPSQVPLLYALLSLQFAVAAFYDPGAWGLGAPRKALVPVLVPAHSLHLATTIDSFAWSLTGAVGAACGGVLASRLGNQACFLVDSATYVAAAMLASRVPLALGEPDAAARRLRKRRSLARADVAADLELARVGQEGQVLAVAVGGQGDEAAGGDHEGPATQAERRHHPHHTQRHGDGEAAQAAEARDGATAPCDSPVGGTVWRRAAGVLAAARRGVAEGWRASAEGWRFAAARGNADVAALLGMKGCAALCWGAIDLLNVKLSEAPAYALGDPATTLGLIFAAVGLGCFLGPIAMNRLVAPAPAPLRWGVAASYALFFAGLLLLAAAPGAALLLAATLVRSAGSATLWVFSTLLLQKRVPNQLLGRMSAVESALFTVAEALSSLCAGAALDLLRVPLRALLLALTAAAGAMAAGWAAYAWAANRTAAGGGQRGGYLPVHTADAGSDGDDAAPSH